MRARSLKSNIFIAFAVTLGLTIGMIAFGGMQYCQQWAKAAEVRTLTGAVINFSHITEIQLQRQYLSWKDVLIHGSDSINLENYLDLYEAEERLVHLSINKLLPMLGEIADARFSAEQFLIEHIQLGQNYREGIRLFAEDKTKAAAIDQKVRNFHDAPDRHLKDVQKQIAKFQTAHLAHMNESLNDTVMQYLLVFGLLLTGLLLSVYRYIKRSAVRPLQEAAETAKQIAQGQRNVSIGITGGREIRQLFSALDAMQSNLRASENFLMREIREYKRVQQEIDRHRYFDLLTGLANRRQLAEQLERSLSEFRRHKKRVGLFLLDLDHFKIVNDSLGNSIGDQLLKEIAYRLTLHFRHDCFVARLGGDEFALMITGLGGESRSPTECAMELLERIWGLLADPIEISSRRLHVTFSIGITLHPSALDSVENIFRQANTALHRAKRSGRNTACFYSPIMQVEADAHFLLQNDLKLAVENKDFSLFYQPQVDSGGQVVAVEALIRWYHSFHRGYITPDEFIPLAEANGLIVPIGEWVLREACDRIQQLSNENLMPPLEYIAVNISPKQFHQPQFQDLVQKVLTETAIEPNKLVMEITESIVIEDVESTVEKMNQIRNLGVRFSIDDFGTGYSSLSYLKLLPLDMLKIDRSFIVELTSLGSDAAIVSAILSMADNLGFKTVAEGVESEEQFNYLVGKGCQFYQGYLFSPALSFDDLIEYLGKTAR